MLVSLRDSGLHLHERLHRVRVELVGQNDGALLVGLTGDILVVLFDLRFGGAFANLPVVRVVLPNDGAETKTSSNRTHTVIHVTKRWTPARGRDTRGVLDGASSVKEFGKHLLIREGRGVAVSPSVNANVVTVGQTALGLVREIGDIATNVEKGGLQLLLLEVVIELVVGTVGTIVERETECARLRASVNVRHHALVVVLGLRALASSPPAVGVFATVVAIVVHTHIGRTTFTGLALLLLDILGDDTRILDLLPDLLGLIITLLNRGNTAGFGEFLLLEQTGHGLITVLKAVLWLI